MLLICVTIVTVKITSGVSITKGLERLFEQSQFLFLRSALRDVCVRMEGPLYTMAVTLMRHENVLNIPFFLKIFAWHIPYPLRVLSYTI